MTPNPATGLVDVLDLGSKTPDAVIKMWPVDYKEAVLRGGDLKDGSGKRFVLAENYVPPTPA